MSTAKIIGDFDEFKRFGNEILKSMEKAREIALKRAGLKGEAIAKLHISNQDLNWVLLEPKTIATKIRKGYSENILVATSSYFQSITSWADKERCYVGVKKTAKDAEGNVIADIARTHEFGSKAAGIPERPLWRPTYAETLQWWQKEENSPAYIFKQIITKKYSK